MPSVEMIEEGRKKSRVGELTNEKGDTRGIRGLVAPLGPRAICGGLW